MHGNRRKIFAISSYKLVVATLLFAFFSINYIYVNELNAHDFYNLINIAFDFDQATFVAAIDGSYVKAINAVEKIWIKHPFIYLYSYITLFFQYLGFSTFTSVAIICLSSVTISLFLMWKSFILITDDLVLSFLLLLLLTSSASFFSISLVFDSYTVLSTWTAISLFLFCREYYQKKQIKPFILAFIYTMLIGITVYMIIIVCLLESFKAINNIKSNKVNLKAELQRLFKLFMFCLFLGTTLMIIAYPEQVTLLLESPNEYLKRVLWAVVRPGEKASAFEVFYILFANSLIAPAPTMVKIPDGFLMFDLRSLNYNFLQYCALLATYVVILASLFSKKHIAVLPCFIFILVSFLFHIEYHDRGSLFLYSSHLLFPIFLCLAAGTMTINRRVAKILLVLIIGISCWSSFNMQAELIMHIESFESEA